MDVISKKICINNYIDRGLNYELTGFTIGGTIEHYNPNATGMTYSSSLVKFKILFNQNIDDIGLYTDLSIIWDGSKQYHMGDIVLYNNISYKCVVNNSTIGDFLIEPLNCDTYISTNSVGYFEDLSGFTSGFTSGNCQTYLSNAEIPKYWEWEITYDTKETGGTINYVGESKINDFRRYGKTDSDKDLYNPTWNTGFTFDLVDSDGYLNKITNERVDYKNNKQNLYDYIIGATQTDIENTGIHYQDLGNGLSNITYKTTGLNANNSITVPNIRLEHLFGISQEPKIDIDIFIDRGENSTFDKNLKLGEIRKLDDLLNYGNGFFKVKNN